MEVTVSPRTFTVVMTEEEMRYIRKAVGERTGPQDAVEGFGPHIGDEVYGALDDALYAE